MAEGFEPHSATCSGYCNGLHQPKDITVPLASDIDALPWAQAVMSETMRLYPPAWHVERDAVQDDDIAGVAVSAGDTVGISPYLLHRHPEFWPNPEGFDPQRFLPDSASTRPRYAYLPFGGGRRICVGAGLVQLERSTRCAARSTVW